jgi:hypothetical protein
MKRDLVREILRKARVGENSLRVTLTRLKKRHDLKSIQQAACYYIKKKGIDINVSSIIDDVTRGLVREGVTVPAPRSSSVKNSPGKVHKAKLPKLKWLGSHYYSLADRLNGFYGYLFLFENALRLKINSVIESKYSNWWEGKIKSELPDVYKYAEDEQSRQAKLPMVGQAQALQPYDYVTLGHLEQIITKYQSLFVPSVFPNLHFFTGHMVIVKRVRNAIAHMAPSTTLRDIRNAKNEIDILLQHFSTL